MRTITVAPGWRVPLAYLTNVSIYSSWMLFQHIYVYIRHTTDISLIRRYRGLGDSKKITRKHIRIHDELKMIDEINVVHPHLNIFVTISDVKVCFVISILLPSPSPS